MTVKAFYEAILFELRKAKAPHLHLEEFLYFSNKGAQESINTEYERFETEQKVSDAISGITDEATYIFNSNNTVTIKTTFASDVTTSYLSGIRYNSNYVQINAPSNYFHLTSCVPTVASKFNYKCHAAGYAVSVAAKKLSADSQGGNLDNAYLKPWFKRPFFKQVDHLNTSGSNPSNNILTTPDFQIFFGDANKF